MKTIIRLFAFVYLFTPAFAFAQFSNPLRIQEEGTTLAVRSFFNCVGAGITCAIGSSTQYSVTVAAGAGGTLQNVYDNSAGASPSILLTAANAPVRLRGPAVAMGNVFIVETNTPTSILTLTDNGTSSLVSQGALTLTGAAASTWSTSSGVLTLTSAANLAINSGASATGIVLTSGLTDGASRNGLVLNMTNAITTGRILSIQNATVEQLYLRDLGLAVMNARMAGFSFLIDQPAAAGTVGGAWGAAAGKGSDATAGVVGAVGGVASLTGGEGGEGSAARAAGAGEGVSIFGGNAGTNNGGGGANSGGVTIDAGTATGAGTVGTIAIGSTLAGAINYGNGTITHAFTGSLTNNTVSATYVHSAADAIGTAQTSYLTIRNTTAAANNAQQYSPAVFLDGRGWNPTAGASRQSGVYLQAKSIQQTANDPAQALGLFGSVNGGAVSTSAMFELGTYATANLPTVCTNGAIVWDSTTTTIKRCLTNVWASLTSSSDFNFGAFNSLTSTALIGPLSQTTVTNAATIIDAKYTVEIASPDGAGDNFIIKLCSDGGTCGGGNVYVTCTTLCAAAASTVTTCTIDIAAVPVGTTLSWSEEDACATANPAFNVNAHFTNP